MLACCSSVQTRGNLFPGAAMSTFGEGSLGEVAATEDGDEGFFRAETIVVVALHVGQRE